MILNTELKRTVKTFSAFQIVEENKFEFSAEDYSKFKFGANNIAKKYGHILANRFIKQRFDGYYNGEPIVVLPSAYSHIPTASYYMSMHFVDKLNEFLYLKGYAPVEVGKISRNVTYRVDYGEMSAEQRFNLIKNDKFNIDKEFIEGKILIFIDDIKITGTHERIIVKMLNDYNVQNECHMLYLAELVNEEICPKIENVLNHYLVKNISDINSIIKNESFVFNTRVVKYILNSNHKDCFDFLMAQDSEFLSKLFYLSLGNEYYKFPEYKENLKLIEKIIFENN